MLSREFFPALAKNPDVVFLDNAATTQIHSAVLDAVNQHYISGKASPGRGDYSWANRASCDIEYAKQQVSSLFNWDADGIIFTTGSTQGLNWIANWHKDTPCVVITEREHNSNIAPWVAQGRSVENGRLAIMPNFEELVPAFKSHTFFENLPERSLISVATVSNVSGVYPGAYSMILSVAKLYGHTVCLDVSQQVMHLSPHLLALADWLVFSGHKMYGPNGTGAILTKVDTQSLIPAMQGGGSITSTTFSHVSYATDMNRHMPGTPNTASIIGLGVAAELLTYHNTTLDTDDVPGTISAPAPGLELISPYHDMFSYGRTIFSYKVNYDHISPYDIAYRLAEDYNIFVRAGRLCAHPFVDRLTNGKGLLRISTAHYNTADELTKFIDATNEIIEDLR